MQSAVALRSRCNTYVYIYMSSFFLSGRECRWKMNGDVQQLCSQRFFQFSKIPEKVLPISSIKEFSLLQNVGAVH